MLKKSVWFAILCLFGFSCFSQEVELISSLNRSSEKRFQNAVGLGLQFQQKISRHFKVGLACHFNGNDIRFIEVPHIDGDPNLKIVDKIHSFPKRLSLRINIQGALIDHRHFLWSIGPEMSYNHLWGRDEYLENIVPTTVWTAYTEKTGVERCVGLAFISNFEVKEVFKPQLSVCFTIRPEFITDGEFPKGGTPVFSGVLGFTEFQIGIKYRLSK